MSKKISEELHKYFSEMGKKGIKKVSSKYTKDQIKKWRSEGGKNRWKKK